MRKKSMHSFSFLVVLVALAFCSAVWAALFPATALARPEVVLTLHDAERGTSLHLYDGKEAGGPQGSLVYLNDRYHFFAYVFPETTTLVMLPENDDGIILSSKDGKARLRLSGGLAEFVPGGLQGSFDQALGEAGQELVHKIYDPAKGYWELHWKKAGIMHGRKFFIRGENTADCEFTYPLSAEKEYGETLLLTLSLFNRGFY